MLGLRVLIVVWLLALLKKKVNCFRPRRWFLPCMSLLLNLFQFKPLNFQNVGHHSHGEVAIQEGLNRF